MATTKLSLVKIFAVAATAFYTATVAAPAFADARLNATFRSILTLAQNNAITRPDMTMLGRQAVNDIADFSATDSLSLTTDEAARLRRGGLDNINAVFASMTARAPSAQSQTAAEAAIKSMVKKIDRFSTYYTAADYQAIERLKSGMVAGIGVEIDILGNRPAIVGIIAGSPAAASGLRSGDIIHSINDAPVNTATAEEVGALIRGNPGTPVKIGIERASGTQSVEIIRARFRNSPVKSRLIGNDIIYIDLANFSKGAAADVRNAINALKKQAGPRLRGVILDERGNPGGFIEEAHAIADLFLNGGPTVSTGPSPRQATAMNATPGDILNGLPVYVLTSPTSKSGAELVAAALQEHRRAVIIGTQTYGKGSVQGIHNLGQYGGSGTLHLTKAYYFTPGGKSLHNTGVFPDIEYRDPAIRALALQLRRDTPPDPMPRFLHTIASVTKSLCEPTARGTEDYHLACAVEALRNKESLTRTRPYTPG